MCAFERSEKGMRYFMEDIKKKNKTKPNNEKGRTSSTNGASLIGCQHVEDYK